MDYFEPIKPGRTRWVRPFLLIVLAILVVGIRLGFSVEKHKTKPKSNFVAVACPIEPGATVVTPPEWHLPFRPPCP